MNISKFQDAVDNTDTVRWWKRAVFYEVYVDQFAGTFAGLTHRLDYLKLLGVDCIHLLPYYPSPMIDGGYDVTDYMDVRKDLGTLEDFAKFIKNAHEMGIRVMIDFVLNHTSTEHPWFIKARSSIQNEKRDFFLWSKTGKEYAEVSNSFSDLNPSNWIYNRDTDDYYFSTFHEKQADLNWNNPRVFSEMMRVLDFWINIGVDAFRLDAASHLIKKEGTTSKGLPETHAILKKIRAYLDQNHHPIPLLAEANDSIQKTKEYFGNGNECHLAYNFPLVGSLLLAFKRNDPTLLQKTIEASSGIPENCGWANFLGHHDEMSLEIFDDKEREELLAYFDLKKKYRFSNGISLRLATLADGNREKMLEVFRMLFNASGSPIIYYGDEIGMENEWLPREEKDTRKSVRGKFNWSTADAEISNPKSLFAGVSNIVKEWKQGFTSASNRLLA